VGPHRFRNVAQEQKVPGRGGNSTQKRLDKF
jgi:hypothetical protein